MLAFALAGLEVVTMDDDSSGLFDFGQEEADDAEEPVVPETPLTIADTLVGEPPIRHASEGGGRKGGTSPGAVSPSVRKLANVRELSEDVESSGAERVQKVDGDPSRLERREVGAVAASSSDRKLGSGRKDKTSSRDSKARWFESKLARVGAGLVCGIALLVIGAIAGTSSDTSPLIESALAHDVENIRIGVAGGRAWFRRKVSKAELASGWASILCGLPDVSIQLTSVSVRSLADAEGSGFARLLQAEEGKRVAACGMKAAKRLGRAPVGFASWKQGDEVAKVALVEVEADEKLTWLPGKKVRVGDVSGRETHSSSRGGKYVAVVREGILVAGEMSHVRAYLSRGGSKTSDTKDVLRDSVPVGWRAQVSTRPTTFHFENLCVMAAPVGSEVEFVQACVPHHDRQEANKVLSRLDGLATMVSNPSREGEEELSYRLMAVAREEADAQVVASFMRRSWGSTMHLVSSNSGRLRAIVDKRSASDPWSERIFDTWLKLMHRATVQRRGRVVTLSASRKLKDGTQKALLALRNFANDSTKHIDDVLRPWLRGERASKVEMSKLLPPPVVEWWAIDTLDKAMCKKMSGHVDKLAAEPEFPIEDFGRKFQLQKLFGPAKCSGARWGKDFVDCVVGAKSIDAIEGCRQPKHPNAKVALDFLAGRWQAMHVEGRGRALATRQAIARLADTTLSFKADGTVDFLLEGIRATGKSKLRGATEGTVTLRLPVKERRAKLCPYQGWRSAGNNSCKPRRAIAAGPHWYEVRFVHQALIKVRRVGSDLTLTYVKAREP